MEEQEQELKPKRKARTVRAKKPTEAKAIQTDAKATQTETNAAKAESKIQTNTPVQQPRQSNISDIEVAKKLINIYQSAQDRKLQFNLSFEYVRRMLEYKTCYYTNKPFTEDGPNARSFDRIDSDKGYIEGNVVACTIDINGKKSNLSFEEISCIYQKLVKKKTKEGAKKAEADEFFAIEADDRK